MQASFRLITPNLNKENYQKVIREDLPVLRKE
ncbi:MAG: hypothetical protein MRERC_12c001 [Mycoplasmataceae bacterium RC_NB112A]|nr:MAG: hypothetical protein MRERC_12c001 [Mycoplasmataceae bacterium RC_NB112A]